MNNKSEPKNDAAAGSPAGNVAAPRSNSRRRLLRGGLSAAPALLALKATPVLAGGTCRQPSGFSTSGAQSRGETSCGTTCYKPTVCKTKMNPSNTNCYEGTSCYKTTWFCGDGKTGYKAGFKVPTENQFKDCLSDDSNVQHMAVACYIHTKRSDVNATVFPSATTLQNIWSGYLAGSYQVPNSGGATWNQAKIKAYLQYLTGQPFSFV